MYLKHTTFVLYAIVLVLLNFRLVEAGKQLFVITNSPFETVDKGMSFMVGASWRDLFDVIIVQVRV